MSNKKSLFANSTQKNVKWCFSKTDLLVSNNNTAQLETETVNVTVQCKLIAILLVVNR